MFDRDHDRCFRLVLKYKYFLSDTNINQNVYDISNSTIRVEFKSIVMNFAAQTRQLKKALKTTSWFLTDHDLFLEFYKRRSSIKKNTLN